MFEGLKVEDMEKELHPTGYTNGHSQDESHTNGVKPEENKKSTLGNVAQAATSAITQGLNSLKVSN